ncbi:right-handed parallel beta-helix repeat-containing protein [Corallococcus exiguus]|uniref:NosD domain-containing protein n=1 Tax=Corallococcus exiguus TaxID=83462 RepID=UPI001A8FFE2E|nr:NosD domain-containing protein [Corallococcus exiguus]MBN8466230.1 right-handed parallel beta-helix repeat-containing protein [Corallococcus exiguus]
MALVDNYRVAGDADDTASFTRALAANGLVELGGKTYTISGTIALTSNKRLTGQGSGVSIIRMAQQSLPAITIAAGANAVQIDNLAVTRPINAPGLANGDGIQCLGASEGVSLTSVELSHHFRCFVGRNTNGGTLKSVGASQCNSHGFELSHNPNLVPNVPLQWSLTDCGSGFASGNGFYVHSETYTGAAGTYGNVSLGTYTNLTTFANAGNGLRVEGNARVAVHSVRLFGGFFGEDGQDGVYVDGGPNGSAQDQGARGTNHIIAPNFVELAGLGYSGPYNDPSTGTLVQKTNAVGRFLTLTASQSGVGVKVSHCINAIIRPAVVNGATWDGIFTHNVRGVSVQNVQVSNNGLNVSGGRRNGIYLYQCERQQVTGCRVFGQERGLAWTNNDIVITGNDFRDNSSGPYAGPGATALPNSTCVGNLPSNV